MTKKKRRKRTGYMRFTISSMTVNGEKFKGIQYERIAYDDGTVKETGLPPGVPKGLPVVTLLEMAFSI